MGGGIDRIKGEGNEQQSDRAEKHHQNRLYLAVSRSKKWDFWLKMLRGYIQNCASYAGGDTLSENHEKIVAGKWKMELN